MAATAVRSNPLAHSDRPHSPALHYRTMSHTQSNGRATPLHLDTSFSNASTPQVIQTPVTANKLATPFYASLYQKCIIIRERWARVQGFPEAFLDADAPFAPDAHDPNLPIDPVSVVCHCLRLGASLCFLFNALRLQTQLDINYDAKPTNISSCKKSAAHFLMAAKRELGWTDNDIFMIKQLYEQDTNGVVRVVDCVLKLLGELELRGLLLEPLILPESERDTVTALDDRGKVVREILSTERDYVAALEILQCYKQELIAHDVVSRDLIHDLFMNLDQLLDFQQRFLIGIEAHADQPVENQRFGHLFLSMEDGFSVYESYCSNFLVAQNLVEELKPILFDFQQRQSQAGSNEMSRILDPNLELPSQLIKPIQRICKYPLLLEQLIKVSNTKALHAAELQQGLDAIRRVADRVNENKRQRENEEAVAELGRRVEDWKGHDVTSFGPLLLEGTFAVIKNDNEREYHVYLFSRIILCCKESGTIGKKSSKSNSLINRKSSSKRRDSLQLKGRIFINNVVEAAVAGPALLQVTWKGDAGNEHFSIKCKQDSVMKQWQKAITNAVEDAHNAKKPRTSTQHLRSRINSPHSQFPNTPISELGTPSILSTTSSDHSLPTYRANHGSYPPIYSSGLQQVNVFDQEAGQYIENQSTPKDNTPRGLGYTQSMPSGARNSQTDSSTRPRAQTQDSNSHIINQWRTHTPAMPTLPRGASISSATSDASTSQDGRSLKTSAGQKALKHKQSHEWGSAGFGRDSIQSGSTVQGHKSAQSMSRNGSQTSTLPSQVAPPMLGQRNRSASSPHVYQVPPMSRHGSQQSESYGHPIPSRMPLTLLKGKGNMSSATLHSSASASTAEEKRFSASSVGSHRSSGDSSQAYTNGSSPLNPLPPTSFISERQYQDPTTVRIKIRLGPDAFVIAAVATIGYQELVERTIKKIRYTVPESKIDERNIRMKWKDVEGDMISISSTEDLSIALEGGEISQQSGSLSLTVYIS